MQPALTAPSAAPTGVTAGGEDPLRRPKEPVTLSQLKRLKEDVLARRPALKNMLEDHGGRTLYSYMREYVAPLHSKLPPALRQQQLIAAIGA